MISERLAVSDLSPPSAPHPDTLWNPESVCLSVIPREVHHILKQPVYSPLDYTIQTPAGGRGRRGCGGAGCSTDGVDP